MPASRSTVRLGILGMTLALLVAGGCQCGSGPVEHLDGGVKCHDDACCQKTHSSRWLWSSSQNKCVKGPIYCDTSGDDQCCPGEVCSSSTQICQEKYDICTTDADCSVAGQTCTTKTFNGANEQVCTFALCDSSGACTDPSLTCFAGFCVGENPCNGSCPAGQACSLSNNRCMATKACNVTCEPGTLAAFDDPNNIDDDCNMKTLTCSCHPLPPLTARDVGRHSGLAVLSDGTAEVSAYDGDHGDLVVVDFDAQGNKTGTTWVDGLPAGGVPTADPNGPRGGIADPGPDVGRYTDIAAASDGSLHVSYYDVDNGDLKYARRSAGTWSTETVDSAGDVGMYTSIALDSGGVPVIAYFQKAGDASNTYTTALKVARAHSAAPTGPSDWDVVTVDSAAITPPPCNGSCATGTVCVDVGNGPECRGAFTDCAPSCGTGQVCADTGTTHACETNLTPSGIDDLPEGVGLMPSIVVDSSGIGVAYYDRTGGLLKIARGVDPAGGSAGTVSTVDGDATTDVGRFCSMTTDGGGNYVIAYQDTTHKAVKYAVVAESDGTVSDVGVVDDGLRDPAKNGPSLVGNDNAIVIQGGRWFVAYQDGTAGDLDLSTRATDGTWSLQTVVSQGSAGYWADAKWHGSNLYISHDVLKGSRTGPMYTTLRLEVLTP